MRRQTATVVLMAACALGGPACGGKKRPAPAGADAAPPVVRVQLDAAVVVPLTAPEQLGALPGVDPAKLSPDCRAYAETLVEVLAEVEAGRAALASAGGAADVGAVERFADAVHAARERLRPLAPAAGGDLGVLHNGLMGALDRVVTGARDAVVAARGADREALGAADAKIAAGAGDLRFLLERLAVICATGS